ncbi:MAG: NFACT RNA binding domain-containing protein [Runella sp.]
MHQNYHFLLHLTQALRPKVVGLRFMECFSQEKDELVIVLAQARGKHNYYRPFFIRATLRPDFACLNFPEDFNRARQNSVDLFENLYDLEVKNIRQFKNERAFGIELDNDFTLVFKLFGNRSNVVLFQGEQVLSLFHNKLVSDNHLILSQLDREIDQSEEAIAAANGDYRKVFPTFGKEINAYLNQAPKPPKEASENSKPLSGVWGHLLSPNFHITRWNHTLTLSMVPIGEILRTHHDPIKALNDFYTSYQRVSVIEREKGEALRVLQKRIQRTQTYINDTLEKLIKIDEGVKNEEIGHILMANLHQIPERAERITLFDFYRNQDITIKLKPDLSPQRNAETYYRKAKNERIEIEKLQENIRLREAELKDYQLKYTEIERIESLKELRKYLKNNAILNESQHLSPTELFKYTEVEGFMILIGKNAKNNDLLTKKYTYKEDLWLHARDVAGSHVVLKYKAGKKFPNSVIERAAQLAAWYSKRRNDSLCPVIVTPKKYVRKPKGLPEGEVIVEKEEVVMVEPKGL